MKMIKKIAAFGLLGSMLIACDQQQETTTFVLENEKDSLSYAIGFNIAKQINGQGLDTMNIDAFCQAINDEMSGNEYALSEDDIKDVMTNFSEKMQAEAREKQLEEQKLDEGRKRDPEEFVTKDEVNGEMQTTASGLQYQVMIEGDGLKPASVESEVRVHYHGTLLDGTVFDSSVLRGQTITFPLNRVIPGWTEGVQLMNIGSKYKFIIPSALAYGEKGTQGIAPNSDLIFFVELFDAK